MVNTSALLGQEVPLATNETIEMLKVILLVCLFIPDVCYAMGLSDLIVGVSPDAKIYLYGVMSIFAVGMIGIKVI